MDVSVIVLNYNGRDLTPECLASIPRGVQTVVVDNGSTDGSADEIEARFPWVKLLREPVNRGFAAGMNRGIARASGRFLCLLNNDARLVPRALETMAGYLAENPEVGIVAPQLLHEDGRRQHSFAPLPSLATEILNKSLLRLVVPGRFPSARKAYYDPLEVPSVIGACMMVRREVVDRIGGLDEAYFLFLEETDFCLRARRAGYRVVFLPWAAAIHLQGRTRETVATPARVEYVRSLFTFFRKHRGLSYPLLRILYPLKNLVELLTLPLSAPFSARSRRRWKEAALLLAWQAAGCPRSWGLSSAAAPRYARFEAGGARWWVAEGEVDTFRHFEALVSSRRVLKDLKLKRTEECRLGYRTFLVKTYKSGPWLRRLRTLILGSRALHELKMSDGLLRLAVPTVPLAAAGERGAESWVAVEVRPGCRQLQEVLLSPSTTPARRRELLFEYGQFARRLHDAGVSQYDFNPSNVLVDGDELRVIDFEKMRLYHAPVPRRVRYRALAKMNRIPLLSRTDRFRFLKGYLQAHRVEEIAWKSIAREILRRWKRLADRDARRAGRRCVRENRDFAPFDFGEVAGFYRKARPENPGVGLTPEELRPAATEPGFAGFRPVECPDALQAWKEANRESRRRDGPEPLAVLIRRGERRGTILYPPVRG